MVQLIISSILTFTGTHHSVKRTMSGKSSSILSMCTSVSIGCWLSSAFLQMNADIATTHHLASQWISTAMLWGLLLAHVSMSQQQVLLVFMAKVQRCLLLNYTPRKLLAYAWVLSFHCMELRASNIACTQSSGAFTVSLLHLLPAASYVWPKCTHLLTWVCMCVMVIALVPDRMAALHANLHVPFCWLLP